MRKIAIKSTIRAIHLPISITVVTAWAYWWGNSSLYLSSNDAQRFQLMVDHKLTRGNIGPSVNVDYLMGLGIRDYSTFLLVDVPGTLSRLIGGEFRDWIFASVSALALYLATVRFFSTISKAQLAPRLASAITVFVLVLPTPFKWTQVPLNHFNVWWCLTLLLIAIECQLKALDPTRGSHKCILLALSATVFSYLSAAVYLNWAVVVVAAHLCFALAMFGASDAHLTGWLKQLSRSFAPVAGAGFALFNSFRLIRASAAGSQSEFVSSIHMVSERQFLWVFDELAQSPIPGYRPIVLTLALVGVVFVMRSQEKASKCLVLIPLFLFTLYGIASPLINRWSRQEITFNSNYLALFALPLLAFVVSHTVLEIGRLASTKFRIGVAHLLVGTTKEIGLTVALVLWAVLWSVDNRHLRDEQWRFPREISRPVSLLTALQWNVGSEFQGRVLVLQSPNETRGRALDEVLFASPEMKLLSNELYRERIPNLTTYSHFISPSLAQTVNERLSDGRPFSRAFLVPNQIDLGLVRDLKVRYVLSVGELESDELKLVETSEHPSTGRAIYLYETIGLPPHIQAMGGSEFSERVIQFPSSVVPKELVPYMPHQAGSRDSSPGRAKVVLLKDGLEIETTNEVPSLFILPFEYDQCIEVVPKTSSVKLAKVDNLLLGLWAESASNLQLRYKNSALGTIPCS